MKTYSFVEISVGQKVAFTEKITRDKVQAFVKLTGDTNPLHTEPDYAATCGHRDIVVHGLLTAGMLSRLAGLHMPGKRALLLGVTVDFVKPVYPEDVLEFEGIVEEKHENFLYIVLKVQALNQSKEQVLRGQMKIGVRNE